MNAIEHLFTRTSKPKIYINTPTTTISEHVQKALFQLGYHWAGPNRRPKFTSNAYVVVYRTDKSLLTNDIYDSDAYLAEANILLHGNALKKLH